MLSAQRGRCPLTFLKIIAQGKVAPLRQRTQFAVRLIGLSFKSQKIAAVSTARFSRAIFFLAALPDSVRRGLYASRRAAVCRIGKVDGGDKGTFSPQIFRGPALRLLEYRLRHPTLPEGARADVGDGRGDGHGKVVCVAAVGKRLAFDALECGGQRDAAQAAADGKRPAADARDTLADDDAFERRAVVKGAVADRSDCRRGRRPSGERRNRGRRPRPTPSGIRGV